MLKKKKHSHFWKSLKHFLKEVADDNDDPKKYINVGKTTIFYRNGDEVSVKINKNTYYEELSNIFYQWDDTCKDKVIKNFTKIINNCTDSCKLYYKAFNKIWNRLNEKWLFDFDNNTPQRLIKLTFDRISEIKEYTRQVFVEVNDNCKTKDDLPCRGYKNGKYIIDVGEPETEQEFVIETGGKRRTKRRTRRKTNKRRNKNKKSLTISLVIFYIILLFFQCR